MMLADRVDVEAGLIGQLGLLDQIAQPLGHADGLTRHRVGRQLRECVEADLHLTPGRVVGAESVGP